MPRFLATLSDHPRVVSALGAFAGWKAFDWLHAAQFTAACLASLVSLCALILTGPPAFAKVRAAVAKARAWFRRSAP